MQDGSVTSLVYISTAIEQCDIVSRWLPTVTTSTKCILVIRFSYETTSFFRARFMRCDIFVLIDSTSILSF